MITALFPRLQGLLQGPAGAPAGGVALGGRGEEAGTGGRGDAGRGGGHLLPPQTAVFILTLTVDRRPLDCFIDRRRAEAALAGGGRGEEAPAGAATQAEEVVVPKELYQRSCSFITEQSKPIM